MCRFYAFKRGKSFVWELWTFLERATPRWISCLIGNEITWFHEQPYKNLSAVLSRTQTHGNTHVRCEQSCGCAQCVGAQRVSDWMSRFRRVYVICGKPAASTIQITSSSGANTTRYRVNGAAESTCTGHAVAMREQQLIMPMLA